MNKICFVGHDIGIWMRRPKHLDLVSKHIATINIIFMDHYINEMGMPIRRSELSNHRLITYGTGKPSPLSDTNWILTTGQKKILNLENLTSQLITYIGYLLQLKLGWSSSTS